MTDAPDLSALIRRGRAGEVSQPDFARAFADTRVLLLSGTEPTDDAAAEPLVLELPSGKPAVAVFAGPDDVHDDYLAAARHPLPLLGRELLEMLPREVGLALNPGRPDSLVIEPDEIPAFLFVALNPPAPGDGVLPATPAK
jgi:hypothetical protein